MSRLVTIFVGVALVASVARATPANKAALERHFEGFLPKKLQACTTCHQATEVKEPESLDDIPHNTFGAALAAAKKRLKAEGKPHDLVARLTLISGEDADGDGVDNLTELLLGHGPGDPADVPSAAELKAAPEVRARFAAFLVSYRWRPFEPATRPAIPAIAVDDAVRNPIDAFVAERRRAHGLTASAEASKGVLLRRVYLDLIGLIPTPEEIAAYEGDASEDAYERVVDRLLADPRYGQRWGRHWMDVWRYCDWAGYGAQVRDSQPNVWRWRDWIVESLNADKGYDRMVCEMLAADELSPTDADALRATGFLVRNYKLLSREQWLEDTLNHTGRAFLGLTVHCAKCHDHKFDPVSQEEYYQLRAVFEPHNVRTDRVAGSADRAKAGLVRAYDKDLAAETWFFTRGDERTPDKARGAMQPGVPAFLNVPFAVEAVKLPREAAHPDRTDAARFDLLAESGRAVEAARTKYGPMKDDAKLAVRQRAEAEAALAAARAKHEALVAVCRAEEIEDAGRKDSAEWVAASTGVSAAQRRAAVAEATVNLLSLQNAADDARRRLEEANKVFAAPPATKPTTNPAADKAAMEKAIAAAKAAAGKATADLAAAQGKIEPAQQALAAAVAALGAAPTTAYTPRKTDDYPETSTGRRLAFARWLVDPRNPLTARVAVNHLWARHFGTGIVPSVDDFGRNGRTATHPALLDYLATELVANGWRMKPIHRLIVTSATYRQASLTNAKKAAVDPDDAWLWRFPSRRMEAELVRDNVLAAAGNLDTSIGGPEVDHHLGLTSRRRSLYLRVAPEKEVEFLKVFDGPNPNECYLRRPSVMPQQALALANSELVVTQAKVLAKALGGGDAEGFVRRAFLRVLARTATGEEVAACREFLNDPKVTPERARENLIIVLFNHNDFVTIR